MTYPFSDLALARRLERAEGAANAAFVDARATLDPASGACWRDVDGTWAMFDGIGSPLTQTFCFGTRGEVHVDTLATIEAFYRERGATVEHEVSPITEGDALPVLTARGYVPLELTNVMFQPIGTPRPAPAVDDDIAVRVIDVTEADEWAETAAQGWSESPEVVPFVRAIGAVYARVPRARCFLATVGGTPAAAGVLLTHEGVALLGGASTVPAHRRRGAQLALLHARLEAARHIGCDLAMMSARPGSGSQRNAERHGFRIAYTRIKWRLSNP